MTQLADCPCQPVPPYAHGVGHCKCCKPCDECCGDILITFQCNSKTPLREITEKEVIDIETIPFWTY